MSFVAACVKAPLERKEVKVAKDHLWLPLAKKQHDFRAVELTRAAVLAKACGLNPKPFMKDIEAMIMKAKKPYQGNVGAVIVGLSYAGYSVKKLMKWSEEIVKNESEFSEFDKSNRAWRVVVAQSFAEIALYVEDRKMYEKFLSMCAPSGVKSLRRVDALQGEKRDKALKNCLYLNWEPFKKIVTTKPQRLIPLGDEVYEGR